MEGRTRFGFGKLRVTSTTSWSAFGTGSMGPVGREYAIVWGGLKTQWNASAPDTQLQIAQQIFAVSPSGNFRPGATGTDTLVLFDGIFGAPPTPAYDMGSTVDQTPGSERMLFIGGRNVNGVLCNYTQYADALIPAGGGAFGGFPSGPNMNQARAWPSQSRGCDSYVVTDFFGNKLAGFIALGGGREGNNAAAMDSFETYLSQSVGLQQWVQHGTNFFRHEGGAVATFPDQSHALFCGGDAAFPANSGSEIVTLQDGLYTVSKISGTQPTARIRFANGWDNAGRFWMVGGRLVSSGLCTNETWYFTPSALSWTQGPNLPATSSDGAFVASTLPGSDEILVIGGNISDAPTNGYTLRTLDPSGSWQALTPALWTPRPRNHRATAVTISGSSRPLVYGGEVQRLDTTWNAEQRAREELVEASQTIPFGSTGTITLPAAAYQVGASFDTLTVTSIPGQTFHPLTSLVLSNLSATDLTQKPNYEVVSSASVNSTSGTRVGYSIEKISGTAVERLQVYVPHGGLINGTTLKVTAGNRAFPGWTAGPITDITPEFLNYFPGATSAPGTQYLVTGRWLDLCFGINFTNNAVYGNGAVFTGTIVADAAFSMTLQTPRYDARTFDVFGNLRYLRQNTAHTVNGVFNVNGSLVTINTPPFTWTSNNSGALRHGNDADSDYPVGLYFPLSESAGTHTAIDTKTNTTFNIDSTWYASQGINTGSNPVGNAYLWRSNIYAPNTGVSGGGASDWSLSKWPGLRAALGAGSFTVEFWYFSTTTPPVAGLGYQAGRFGNLDIDSGGWWPSFFPPSGSGPTRAAYIADDISDNTANGYIVTIAAPPDNSGLINHGGPTPAQESPFNNVGGTYQTNALHYFNLGQDWTRNCMLQVGVDTNNYIFIAQDVGYCYTAGPTVYRPTPNYYYLTGSALPIQDHTWHFVSVAVSGGVASLRVDGNFQASANVQQAFGGANTGPNNPSVYYYPDSVKPYYFGIPFNPGDNAYVYFGPTRDVRVYDLTIHSYAPSISQPGQQGSHTNRIIDRRNGVVF